MTITPVIFHTPGFRRQDQFEAWHSFFEPVIDVATDQAAQGGFAAEVRVWVLGHFGMTRTIAPPVHAIRTRHHLRLDPVDHWIISYCARGAHSATTAGLSVEVPQRVPFLWSLGQEFVHERTHTDRIQLMLARDGFREIAPLLDAALGSILDTPLGHVLGDYMSALDRCLPDLTEADLPRLNAAVAAMVSAAVAPTAARVETARRQIDLGRMERVRQVVRRHLCNPTLQPNTLCRLVGMSRSNLYRLFKGRGGLAQYIQSQRLFEAHTILGNPANPISISALAEDLCFADASSFSRAFRREFGASPSEVRAAALCGPPPPWLPRLRVGGEKSDFGALLRGF